MQRSPFARMRDLCVTWTHVIMCTAKNLSHADDMLRPSDPDPSASLGVTWERLG